MCASAAAPQPQTGIQVQRNCFLNLARAVQAIWAGVLGGKSGVALPNIGVLNVEVPSFELICFRILQHHGLRRGDCGLLKMQASFNP
jgi:hypothetical protein